MTKKNKSKNAKPAAEQSAVAENEKKPITPKKLKPGSEIDDIFAGKKRKKPEKDAAAASEDSMREPKRATKKDSKVRKENGSVSIKKDSKVRKENGSVSGSRPRKRTGDGLSIFTEEELGIGKADAGDCERVKGRWKFRETRIKDKAILEFWEELETHNCMMIKKT